MSQVHATESRQGTSSRLNRQLIGMAGSVALAVLLSGNVAAAQLAGDDRVVNAPLVTPKLDSRVGPSQHLKFKLTTTTGYYILVYG
jgi:hypothetical protein